MSDELVKRLRTYDEFEQDRDGQIICQKCEITHEAADRIEQLTAERDRLREALRDGRRLLAIAQDDRVRLLIQIEQCEKRHE